MGPQNIEIITTLLRLNWGDVCERPFEGPSINEQLHLLPRKTISNLPAAFTRYLFCLSLYKGVTLFV